MIRRWGFPFNRVDHKNCQLWLPMPRLSRKWKHPPTCVNCTQLFNYLLKESRRKASITPSHKRKRLLPSYNYPVSPCSVTTLARKDQFKVTKAARESSLDINSLISPLLSSRTYYEKLIRKAKGKICDNCGGKMLKIDLHFKRTRRKMVCMYNNM